MGPNQTVAFTLALIKLAASGSGAVQRELQRFHRQAGLVSVKQVGNQKHYQAKCETRLIFTETYGHYQKTVGYSRDHYASIGKRFAMRSQRLLIWFGCQKDQIRPTAILT